MSKTNGIIVSSWNRQLHRWVAIAFTATVIANFLVRAKRRHSALGDLLASAAARGAFVDGSLLVCDALYREMAQRERSMKMSSTGAGSASA